MGTAIIVKFLAKFTDRMYNYTMKNLLKILIAAIIFLLIIPFTAFAWSGKCVAVTDGDIIKVMHNGKAEKIRLYGIDCPEKRQTFGKKAKQFTAEMVFRKIVDVNPVTVDSYDGTIAWVYVNNKCLNKELLKAGLAWHYKQYSKDRDLAELEEEARSKVIGLWSDHDSIPPWIWRKLYKRVYH